MEKKSQNMLQISDAAAQLTKALQALQESRNASFKAIADLHRSESRKDLFDKFIQSHRAYEATLNEALNLQFLIDAQKAE